MSSGQHHKRLALLTAAGLCIAAIAGISGAIMPRGETLWHLIAAPEEDGLWQFESIDGTNVKSIGYSVRIRWGAVGEWYDGCNYCGQSDEGHRICTLQACIERPTDGLYRSFVERTRTIRVDGDSMVMTIPGHRAVLRRFTEQKL